MRIWSLACASLALAGCLLGDAGKGGGKPDAGPSPTPTPTPTPTPGPDAGPGTQCLSGSAGGAPDIDLLFVIDNSGSMAQEQADLVAQFGTLIGALETSAGGLPNLHIGVISTDLGAGPFMLQSCERANGDRGALQITPRVTGCTPPQGNFIVDVDGPAGRMKNYSGALADTFACIARLGTDGCGFEQPLEAMKRALDGSNVANAGFLRPSALLAVVFLGDEDDCSALAPERLYDPSQNTVGSVLGPLTSYRCFDFGVTCDGNLPRTQPGPRENCRSNESSPLVSPVGRYVDFLRGLKGDLVVVSTITGNVSPVETGTDAMNNPLLLSSCESARGLAVPAVRLQQVALALDGAIPSICSNDWQVALRRVQMVAAGLPRCQ